jgi:hypothetical protein
MNLLLKTGILAAILAVPVLSVGGPFDVRDILSKDDDKGKKVDIDGLTARGSALVGKVSKATIAFGEAVIEMQYAVGNAAAAEKLKGAIDNAKSKKDEGTTKVLVGEVNNAINEMNQIDLQAKMDLEKARISLGKSLLKLGSGSLLDASALSEAKAMLAEATSALSHVKSSPMKYGPTALKNVQSAMSASQFTVDNVPPQVNSVATFSDKLREYAKTNKIETPSKEQTELMAKDMEKE